MIPYYAVHSSPVLPSVHLPRSSPDCPLHAAIWAGAQAAFPSDPQGQVKGCLLYLLPSASILPASSFLCFLFSYSSTRPFQPSSRGLWLQVHSVLLAGFYVSREAQPWGLRHHWDKSQADCAFPPGGYGWTLWMTHTIPFGEKNCDPLFMAAPRACQFACK